ncbi:hypothetical protein CDSM653_00354 [Caldanaerobacter subterraneus subsp. pacificus DSM 12653]|nr:hypothetical protein CDSM653_00354 [Caldanaerobacter subterraneus subsp. pacificus DSM 12653]
MASYLSKTLSWGTDLLVVTPFVDEGMLSLVERFFGDKDVMLVYMSSKGIENVPHNVKLFYYSEEGKEIEVVG